MFHVNRKSAHRLDIEISGKLNAEEMKDVIDELIRSAEDIEHGRMLYKLGDVDLPTLGAMGVELSRIPQLFRFIKKFDRAAVIAGKTWIRKASEIEGAVIPGLEIKTFDVDQEPAAEAWLERNEKLP